MKRALIISCFDWYENRIKPIVEVLEGEYNVTVLTSDYDHIKKERILTKTSDLKYIHVFPYKKNVSVARILSHLEFGINVKRYLNQFRPDLIYLMIPPNNTATYCSNYRKSNPECEFIIDVIDMWPESMPIGRIRNTFIGRCWRRLRDNSIRNSDLIITECDLYRKELEGIIGNQPCYSSYLFKNQSRKERDKIAFAINKYERTEKLQIGYVGSINNLVDIDRICELLRKLIDSGIEVSCHIIGEGNHRKDFVSRLENICETKYYGAIFDENTKINILAKCDFGLNIMRDSVAVGLTIKSMDYFSYGLPLINNIKGDTWDLVSSENLGINIMDINDEIVEQIIEYKFNRNNILEIFEQMFSRDAYKKHIKKILHSAGVMSI